MSLELMISLGEGNFTRLWLLGDNLQCRGRENRNGLDIKWAGKMSCLRCDVCLVYKCSCVGVCTCVILLEKLGGYRE